MCDKRLKYKTRAIAEKAATLVGMKWGSKPMRVYQCPECKLWCMTSNRRKDER